MAATQPVDDSSPSSSSSGGGHGFLLNILASLVATLIVAAASLLAGELERLGQAFALLAVWTIPFVVGILIGWLTNRSRGLPTTVLSVVLAAVSFAAFFVAMPAPNVFLAAVPDEEVVKAAAGRDEPTESDTESRPTTFEIDLDDAVDEQRCTWGNRNARSWSDLAPQFTKETTTPNGIGCEINDNLDEGHVDFLVPEGATSLRAQAGVDSRSENTTTTLNFAVLAVDGTVLQEWDTPYGRPADVDVPVTDHDRVRLRVQVADFVVNPEESPLTAAWGDLRFES